MNIYNLMTLLNVYATAPLMQKPISKIVLLNDAGFSNNGMLPALQFMFPNAKIFQINAAQLASGDIPPTDMLVLPGNDTETSQYPIYFTPNVQLVIKNKIEQDGLILMTFCAASYFLMTDISYIDRQLTPKKAKGLGWITGEASQAFETATRLSPNPSLAKDYIEARLNHAHHAPYELYSLNINGPAFHFTDDLPFPLRDVFLRYADCDDKPAAFIQHIGKGFVVALGVHPELNAQNSSYAQKHSWQFPLHDTSRLTILSYILDKIMHHRAYSNVMQSYA